MDAYSIDKLVCKCGRAEWGRSSVGRISRFRDRSFRRETTLFQLNSTLGRGYSAGNSAGFFQSMTRNPSLIDLQASHSSVRRRIRVTKNQPIHQFLESLNQRRNNSTQDNVQVCTEVSVFGGQQGCLEYMP